MPKILKYIVVLILLILLVLVRGFQTELFYDPFIVYFQNDYLHLPFPEFDAIKLSISLFCRYFVNTLISLAIIYVLFQKKQLKFSLKFYVFAFLILLFLYFISLNYFNSNYLFFFYIRRFLIQPLFVLILIPAFYYQKFNDFNR